MLQILIIVILLVFLYNLIQSRNKKKKDRGKKKASMKSRINENLFFTKEETQDFLKADEDNFVNNLDSINKKARNVNNIYTYFDKIIESAENFSIEDKELLQKVINNAEEMMLKVPYKKLRQYGIDLERLRMLKGLKFALTKDKIYENGFPHTRQNVIFLSTDYLDKNRNEFKKVLKTIIHEIVHIYQRNNGKTYDSFLKEQFWIIVDKPKDIQNRRMNPDLDLNVWEKNDRVYLARFSSSNPKNLHDIDIAEESQYEHPYEFYAYKFSKDILNNVKEDLLKRLN